jgi:hypothetical protein
MFEQFTINYIGRLRYLCHERLDRKWVRSVRMCAEGGGGGKQPGYMYSRDPMPNSTKGNLLSKVPSHVGALGGIWQCMGLPPGQGQSWRIIMQLINLYQVWHRPPTLEYTHDNANLALKVFLCLTLYHDLPITDNGWRRLGFTVHTCFLHINS